MADTGSAPRALLVVDDDDLVGSAITRIFEPRGWQVRRARTGSDAIAQLRAADQPLDAALVDLVLPGVSGLDVVRAIRARHPGCRIVGLTGMTEAAMVRAFTQAGADGFVGKPFELAVLIDAVEGPVGA